MRKAWCSKTKAIIIARTTFQPCIRVLLPKANSTTPIRSLAPLFSTATHSRRARFLTRARSSPTRFRARARSYPSELQDQAPRTRTRAPLSNLRCFGSDSVSRVSLSRGFALVICAVRALPGSVPLARSQGVNWGLPWWSEGRIRTLAPIIGAPPVWYSWHPRARPGQYPRTPGSGMHYAGAVSHTRVPYG
eukprot:257140-Rhodomonas_salina.2